jgi:thioredoxin-dependent peroxiredoxin
LSAVQAGDRAPDFTLPSHGGGDVRLRDLLGRKTIVLYFYPKDHTPGCTAEARAFRDSYETFVAAGAEVVGVSSDSLASHERFAAKHHLPFMLLSDVNGEVRRLYGVEKTLGIIPGRVTYVIDRTGIVRRVFASQFQAERHVQEALRALDGMTPSVPVP